MGKSLPLIINLALVYDPPQSYKNRKTDQPGVHVWFKVSSTSEPTSEMESVGYSYSGYRYSGCKIVKQIH